MLPAAMLSALKKKVLLEFPNSFQCFHYLERCSFSVFHFKPLCVELPFGSWEESPHTNFLALP